MFKKIDYEAIELMESLSDHKSRWFDDISKLENEIMEHWKTTCSQEELELWKLKEIELKNKGSINVG